VWEAPVVDALAKAAGGLFDAPVTSLILTWLAFEVGRLVQRSSNGSPLANPVLIAVVLIIPVLGACGVSYDTYMRGAGFIHFLLGPAAVALAVPIYDNRDRIRESMRGLLAGVAAGATVACASAVALAWWLGGSGEVVRSIAPKSVTTPIAIGISEGIGGRPSMTVVFVIMTGIMGAMFCGRIFDWLGVRDWAARGVAAGVAGHGIATAQILSINQNAGAFAGLSIGLTGLFTALLLPIATYLLPLFMRGN
jgi:predicted murein hydrolase (TIGR00659 family)